jgi:hypothetical protein
MVAPQEQQPQANNQYWLGHLRAAEANPGTIPGARAGANHVYTAPSTAATETTAAPRDHSYWLGHLNQAEARAQSLSAAGASP